jgi:predicted nucleic acid-binding protein
MGIVLDTSALVVLERGETALDATLKDRLDDPMVIPMVVWAEMLVGIRMARTADVAARRRARMEELRLHVPLIPFNAAIAEHYADIFAECIRDGRMIPQNHMAVSRHRQAFRVSCAGESQGRIRFRCVQGLLVITLPL